MDCLTLRLPSNSRNFTIPSRFCVRCSDVVADADAVVSRDPFVSAVDMVALFGGSIGSILVTMRFVAACLNSLFNWNNEKFRRLSVVNLKTFNMFQLLESNFVMSLTAVLARTQLHCLFRSATILPSRSFTYSIFAILLTQTF